VKRGALAFAFGALGALGACKKPPPPDPLAVPSSIPNLALPSARASSHATPALRVYVSKTDLYAGAQPLAKLPPDPQFGFDAAVKRKGRADLLLTPLEGAVHGEKIALVYFDRETTYRVMVEVVFTLAQSGVTEWHLATAPADAGVATLAIKSPDPCAMTVTTLAQASELQGALLGALAGSGSASASAAPPPPPPPSPPSVAPKTRDGAPCPKIDLSKPRLAPSVLIIPSGYSVKAAGSNIAPGCTSVKGGPGVAVPLVNGKHDRAGLAACLRSLKTFAPEYAAETGITISADSAVHAETVLDAIALVQDESGPGFQDVMLGVMR
jgi:biopolymer transport protein ExbD